MQISSSMTALFDLNKIENNVLVQPHLILSKCFTDF